MPPVLVHLSYSPWSEKARWALDHHHVETLRIEHLPLVGEPLLRLASREPFTPQSVPRLFVGGDVIADSLDIARWAEGIGQGSKLFPADRLLEVLAWVEKSEELLRNGRARLVERMLSSKAALREALPAPFRVLGNVGVGIARAATRFIQTKHVKDDVPIAEREERMERLLEDLRRARGQNRYLLGTFTFADIAMASALGVVELRPEAPLGPEQRAAWHVDRLATQFRDLLDWRDSLYATVRRG